MTAQLPSWMTAPSVTQADADEGTALMQLVAKRNLAEGVVELALEPQEGLAPAWEPGAHVSLRLPNGLVRQYSLCGDPQNDDVLRIAVLREERGRGGSRYLHDVAELGDVFPV